MSIRTLFCTLLAGWVLAVPAAAEGKRYALVIGVKSYRPGQPLPPLAYTENDADGLAKVLKTGGYDVTLMTETESRKPGNGVLAPMAAFIRDQLDSVLDNPFLGPDDVVVVALAGHGVQYDLVEGPERTKQFYFCPADADVRTLQTANNINAGNNLIDLQEIYEALKNCKAGGKLLMVDACRNDPTKPSPARALASNTLPPLPPPPGGTAVLFSCSANQKAFEDGELGDGHGVFFHHVIEALGGAADTATATRPADGEITLAELTEHVSATTYDHVRRKFRERQAPELKGEIRVAIPLVRLPEKVVAKPDGPGGGAMKVDPGGAVTVAIGDFYELDLKNLRAGDVPQGWTKEGTAAVDLAEGIPHLGIPVNAVGGTNALSLDGLKLQGDFFLEMEVTVRSHEVLTAFLTTKLPDPGIKWTIHYTQAARFVVDVQGVNKQIELANRRPDSTPVWFRLERRGNQLRALMNADDRTSVVTQVPSPADVEGLKLDFGGRKGAINIRSLRFGPLTPPQRVATGPLVPGRVRAGELPKGWEVVGTRGPDGQIRARNNEAQLGDGFAIDVPLQIEENASMQIALIGHEGGPTVPIFFSNNNNMQIFVGNEMISFPYKSGPQQFRLVRQAGTFRVYFNQPTQVAPFDLPDAVDFGGIQMDVFSRRNQAGWPTVTPLSE